MKKTIAIILSIMFLLSALGITASAKTENFEIFNSEYTLEDYGELAKAEIEAIPAKVLFKILEFADSGKTPGSIWLELPLAMAVVVPPIGILLLPVTTLAGVVMWLTTDFLALLGINIYG